MSIGFYVHLGGYIVLAGLLVYYFVSISKHKPDPQGHAIFWAAWAMIFSANTLIFVRAL